MGARLQDLFASFHKIISRNNLNSIVNDNQKVAVQHVLSAIRPTSLREKLESDLSFSHHSLKKDFHGFLKHTFKLAEPFQLFGAGAATEAQRVQHT